MMNRIVLVLSMLCMSLSVGCASGMVARPAPQQAVVPQQIATATVAPAAYYGQPANMGMVPPGQPPVAGPPQNWAWMNVRPYGCESGPLAMEVRNDTDKFVEVSLDGEPLVIRGAQGVLPGYVPPRASVYLCLSRLGQHTVRGTTYITRMGFMEKDTSQWNKFTSVIDVNSQIVFRINQPLLVTGW